MKRKNAGAGYGYMFSGAFAKKSDAMKKEKSRKGSFIKGVYVNGQHRYAVMTPRTNPVKRKKKAPKTNPTELMVMAANPCENPQNREITVPPGTTITIRTNPAPRPNWMGAESARIRSGIREREDAEYQRTKKVRAKLTRAGEEAADTHYRGMRQRSRVGPKKLRTLFHEVYGRDNPVCGKTIGGEPCTRKPGHRGPCLPQGATMRPISRLRHKWKPRASNPSAAALHSTFTGKDGKWVEVHDEPHMQAGDYAQLGELQALYVKPMVGGQIQTISFPRDSRPLLVCDESARQLYFVDGNQKLGSLAVFGGSTMLGHCVRIDYKQRKEHVPHPDQDEWKHYFGEESGVKPTLRYDFANQRLLLEGGEYRVESAGIIN